MNEMVERVAEALDEVMYKPERKTEWKQAPAQHHHTCRLLARAAIAAMREPTMEMLICDDFPYSSAEARQYWQAMIDEALK